MYLLSTGVLVTELRSPSALRFYALADSGNFAHCKDELPYAIDQRNIGWTELPSGDLRIDQELISPPKKSTEAIVRKRLPGIGKLARQQISEALGRNVQLVLSVGSDDGQNSFAPRPLVGLGRTMR